jgi:hypothetical protein
MVSLFVIQVINSSTVLCGVPICFIMSVRVIILLYCLLELYLRNSMFRSDEIVLIVGTLAKLFDAVDSINSHSA